MSLSEKKVNLDKDAFNKLYLRYKDYLLPIAAVLICLILFVKLIIPQIQNLTDLKKQEEKENQKLQILKNNLTLLYNLNQDTLDNQLKITSKTLPVDKDFIGILNGISVAASRAKVSLGDYGFQVGDLTKLPTSVKGYPSIQLVLNISGNLDNSINFLKELEKTVPISEVTDVNLNNRGSNLSLVFYYKPLAPVKLRDDIPLIPLSSQSINIINNISEWNNIQLLEEEYNISPSSSPSSIFRGLSF